MKTKAVVVFVHLGKSAYFFGWYVASWIIESKNKTTIKGKLPTYFPKRKPFRPPKNTAGRYIRAWFVSGWSEPGSYQRARLSVARPSTCNHAVIGYLFISNLALRWNCLIGCMVTSASCMARARPGGNAEFAWIFRARLASGFCISTARPNRWRSRQLIKIELHPKGLARLNQGNQSPIYVTLAKNNAMKQIVSGFYMQILESDWS